ncbi:MAG: protein kinase [Myxococcales bacterium]|nr:protein kinase [Myxococcales bacterium]MCB9551287.1 protein kinase [Myxococcales bacterium]
MHRPVPFGKYILLERISVGGMAEVFKAKTFGVEGFTRAVAIKRILPHLAEDPRFVEMFINEAKVAVQLNHANIAQVYELGRCDDDHYIAMEYISGKDLLSLAQYVKRTGDRLPVHLAAYIGSRVAEGLGYAHRKTGPDGRPLGIIHRDISPQNVLIAYEGAVKLIDFGIAKAAIHSSHQTQAGVLKGKFGYMSPEQIAGKPLDQRSDIFALGTVLHEMLTGERLFAGDNDFLTLEKVRAAKADAPSRANPDVPPPLDNIVMRALAREPGDRYQAASQFADDLARFLHMSGAGMSAKALKDWMRTRFAGEIADEEAKDEHFARLVLTAEGDLLEEQQPEEDATALWDPLSEDMLPEGMHFEAEEQKPRYVSIARRPFDAPPPPQPPAYVEDESMTVPSPVTGPLPDFDDTGGVTLPSPVSDPPPPPYPAAPPAMPEVGPPSFAGPYAGQPEVYDDPTEWARPPSMVPTTTALPARGSTRRDLIRVAATLLVAGAGGIGVYQLMTRGESTAGLVRLTLHITPPDSLRATIDGRPIDGDQSPLRPPPLPPGAYTVVVERDGYGPQTRRVELIAGKDHDQVIVLDARSDAPGLLKIETLPAGDKTEVEIAGRAIAVADRPKGVELPSGQAIEVIVRRRGYLPRTEPVELEPGETRTLRLELEPAPATLMIDSRPPGQVFVDDKSHRRTPVTIDGLDPRQPHRIRIEARGHRPWEKTVTFDGDSRFERLDAVLDRN